MKVEGAKSKGKEIKRKREDDGNGDLIEIFSDDEDLDSLQVLLRTASHAFRIPDEI